MSVYEPGGVLGEYELIERLGRGGMGEVWLARHRESADRVAIKALFPRPDRREEAKERFEREVEAAKRIGHPGIVRVHGYGADSVTGAMFIVMELLVGMNLRAWLARPSVSTLESLACVRELLEPLAAAHACTSVEGRAAPIIHRDLKPENVFVLDREDDGRRVKLLDFGIARQAGGEHVTETGVGMGTAAYMSPEQATDAREVGPSADVWSVGVMLYEILAGRLPFEAPSRNEIISKILTRDPVPLESIAPHVPRRLARLVSACLSKDPTRRPKDARALAVELDAILDDPSARQRIDALSLVRSELVVDPASTASEAAERATPSSRPRVSVWVAGLALAVLVGVAIPFWPSTEDPVEDPPVAHEPRVIDGGIVDEINPWIAVESGTNRLGITAVRDEFQSGFRPSSNVRAPSAPYAIQEHEVTWGELEAWLPSSVALPILGERRPSWLPLDRAARSRFPATGVPWSMARDYCASVGGSLPSEEQWEHAARGPELRAYAWGDAPPDPERTSFGPDTHPIEVMSRDQDRTPGDAPIWDLTGNAREWTRDVWRGADDGRTQAWAEEHDRTFRAVRGLPLAIASRWRPPDEAPIAHRIPLCATGACPEGTDDVRVDVGFRCVR